MQNTGANLTNLSTRSFGLTWDLVDYIVIYGTRNVFAIVGMIIAVTSLLSLRECIHTQKRARLADHINHLKAMYMYGKRARAWTHRQPWFNFNEEEESLVE